MACEDALVALKRCCASNEWCRLMISYRSYASLEQLLERAKECDAQLKPTDWQEAFAGHPRIGHRPKKQQQTDTWASEEQKSTSNAKETILNELARYNEQYYEKFG